MTNPMSWRLALQDLATGDTAVPTHAFRFEPEEQEFARIVQTMLLGEMVEDIYADDLDDAEVIVDDAADRDC